MSSKWGFQLLSQIFLGHGSVFSHKIHIGVSTDIILLISLRMGWGSTQSLPPLLPFNLQNQHLLQSFPVLFCGTLSGCQCEAIGQLADSICLIRPSEITPSTQHSTVKAQASQGEKSGGLQWVTRSALLPKGQHSQRDAGVTASVLSSSQRQRAF